MPPRLRTTTVASALCATIVVAAADAHADEQAPRPFGGSAEGWRLIAAEAQYEREKRNAWAAFGFEVLFPGAGNFYAGERGDAALTWTGFLIGALFLVRGSGVWCTAGTTASTCGSDVGQLATGWTFLVGSRLFGLTSAPLNVVRNNTALRARLGLEGATLSFAGAPSRGGASFELRMTF